MDTNQLKFLMYRSADGDVSVNAIIKDETIWLTQKAMAELFGVDKSSISRHLKNIFVEGELDENVVVAEIATTTQHGAIRGKTQSRETKFYNLDAIISVGYRVNSRRATQFRIWATGILKEYIIKGFAMDDERLKQARTIFGKDYFRELLERVRSIRASERRIWQRVSGNRSQIFLRSAVSIMIKTPKLLASFMLWSRTNSIMRLPARLLRKSYTAVQTIQKNTWVLLSGRIPRMAEC